jgi:hypothetical protein
MTVGYLPKDIVNQYFAAAKTGVDKAAAELELRSKLGTLRYLLGVKEREAAKDAAAAAAKAAAATAAAAAEPPGEEEQADTRDQGAVEQQQQQQGPPRQEAADAGPAGPGATQQQAAGPAGQGGTEKEDEDELCPVCQVSARLLLPLARLAQIAECSQPPRSAFGRAEPQAEAPSSAGFVHLQVVQDERGHSERPRLHAPPRAPPLPAPLQELLGVELVMLPCGHQLCCKCGVALQEHAGQQTSPQASERRGCCHPEPCKASRRRQAAARACS